MKNLLISFSGGRTSAFMARFIQVNPKYEDYDKLFVFANTGKENEATLEFINKCDEEWNLGVVWLEAEVTHTKGIGTTFKEVTFETASRNGEPFEEVIKKYGLPSKLYRHCTRELKEYPIHKYAKSLFDGQYLTAVGIRSDEPHRLGKKKNIIYPLADLNVDEMFIRHWWSQQSFDLDLKDYQGNCDLCFLKSVRKKLTMLDEDAGTADWWKKMEDLYGGNNQPIFDVYRDLSIEKLVQMAQEPFQKVRDKKDVADESPSMFDVDMDMEFDCFCKMN